MTRHCFFFVCVLLLVTGSSATGVLIQPGASGTCMLLSLQPILAKERHANRHSPHGAPAAATASTFDAGEGVSDLRTHLSNPRWFGGIFDHALYPFLAGMLHESKNTPSGLVFRIMHLTMFVIACYLLLASPS